MSKDVPKLVKQDAFTISINGGWKDLNPLPPMTEKGAYHLRNWQPEAFDLLHDKKRIIINAPTGSGKSALMSFISADKMLRNTKLRTIITVPQSIISAGFTGYTLELPDTQKAHWFVQHNLCSERPDEGTINYTIKFLEGPHAFFADRILICSHATIVAVYKRLKEQGRLGPFRDLMLWVDEAQHLLNVSSSDVEGAYISNGMGELVAHLRKSRTVEIGLATATWGRGDRFTLLTKDMEKEFARYNLPYDEYFKYMKHLKSFTLNFALCGRDFLSAIGQLVGSERRKDIIYIPLPQSRHSTGDKYAEVGSIVANYQKLYGRKVTETADGLTVLTKKNEQFKILDLVDEDRRDAKKEYVNTRLDDRDALDAVIALGMFKEGANWIWAERGIIVGARGSLVEMIQMIGRFLRDAEGKCHVEITLLLPFTLDQTDEDFRDHLNDYLKAIMASMLLEDVFSPCYIKCPKSESEQGEPGGGAPPSPFVEAVPDMDQRLAIYDEIKDALLDIKALSDDTNLWDEYVKFAPHILEEHGVEGDIEAIQKEIWTRFAQRTLKLDGIDVSEITFDMLKEVNPIGFLTMYTSGVCDIATFKQLRDAMGFRYVTEWVPVAERLAKENGGVLPHIYWLANNGYKGLACAMMRRPNLFKHIPQQPKKLRTSKEWVPVAERLAKENGGVLPHPNWLTNNGYSGLVACMRNNPDLFKHIPQQSKKGRRIEEWVPVAEKLAKENGGNLPHSRWLQDKKNGYVGLHSAMCKRPDLFKHIPRQPKKCRKPEEWVPVAEKLAKENGGVLPRPKWLASNGYNALYQATNLFPDLFKHIPQLRLK